MSKGKRMILKLKHIAVMFALVLGGFTMAGTAQASQERSVDMAALPVTAPATSYVQYAQYSQNSQNQPAARANVSYAQAKSIARSQEPGSQVVDIVLKGQTYRVRLQTQDGRVVDVRVDAATGRVR